MMALSPVGACEAVRARLSEYLDGKLDADEHARLVLHHSACAACARAALELAVVIGALYQLSMHRGAHRGA